MRRFFTLLCLSLAFVSSAQQEPAEFHSEFVHVVLFWLNNPENKEERTAFETNLETLLQDSKHTLTNYIGTPPKATREVVDDSFQYMLIVTFPDAAEQDAYQEEKAHLQFIEDTKHLWKKVVVYDAEGKSVIRN